ncbi:MAG TPA: pilus assembly protein TadG-related protein [Bryobacteraceae bacterium]|nr:pilus assembly protein TadG-related protein [Bryobacteraceae bacterium]
MLKKLLSKKPRGQALIMTTMALIPMFGLMGLAVDLGWMEFTKKSAQSAADAAAMAAMLQFQSTIFSLDYTCGVNGVICQAPTSCATLTTGYMHSGCAYAQLNGFSSSGNQYVSLSSGAGVPPTATGVQSSAYWVTARVNQTIPQLFSAVLGNSTGSIAARATAALSPSKDCIYAMDPHGAGSVFMNGTPNLTSSCGVYINSDNAQALQGNGTPTLSATEIDIVGGYSFSGTLNPNPPSTNVATLPDPLRNLPAPTVPAGCDHNNFQVNTPTTTVLTPGVYCGGIYVKKGLASFNPGMYILKGGGLSTQDSNSLISGTGVTLYNTYDPSAPQSSINTYVPFNIVASSTVTLTAPVTGTYAGVLIMEDRSITPTSCGGTICTDNFGGGSSAAYTGIVYGPKSLMNFYGNAGLTAYTIIVAYDIAMNGTTSINNDYTSLPSGNPIKVTALVE